MKKLWPGVLFVVALGSCGTPPDGDVGRLESGVAAGSLAVSQVYGGGGNAGATYTHDFIEVFNRSSGAVSVAGMSVQYASSASGTWSKTDLPSITLQAGQYLLVQEFSAGAIGAALPTPDATGTISMSATAGKVALVSDGVLLSGTCPTDLTVLDLIGYGAAPSCFEGSGPAGAPSNVASAQRLSSGCTDSDDNTNDFTVATADARNTASTPASCMTAPTGVGFSSPSTVSAGATTQLTVTVTPGANPPSTGITVVANLSAIGGLAVQPLFDDGTNGDVTAGDNVFGFLATVSLGTTPGAKLLPATVSDAETRMSSTNISVTVVSPPEAVDDAFTTAEDVPIPIVDVLANDLPNCGALTITAASDPPNGATTLTGGVISYSPDGNFNGTDTFTYTAENACGADTAQVTMTVDPVNDAPVAANDSGTTPEEAPLVVPAAGVLGNDSDVDSPGFTAVLVGSPGNGTLVLGSAGGYTYTPAANFAGSDSFTYRANDGTDLSNLATVTLTVTAVDDPPTASADAYSTAEDTPRTVVAPGVLGNDSDVDSSLIAILDSGVANGTLSLGTDGAFTYTPNGNYAGPDSFTYHARGDGIDSAIVTVSLTVTPVNDAPVATDDGYATSEDVPRVVSAASGVLLNDTDPDSPPSALRALLVDNVDNGTLSLGTDGSFTYTPSANFSGSDSFTYRILDEATFSNIATVSLSIAAVDDPPVAIADSYDTDEDTALTVAAPGILGNDSDPDSSLAAVLDTDVTNGTLALNADGSFTYTPDANVDSSDSFTYHAAGNGVNSATVTVSIGIDPLNDPPTGAADSYAATEDTPLVVATAAGVLANDSDIDNATLTATLATQAANGTVAVGASGSFTYTPDADFFGADSFAYDVSDGAATDGPITVTVTVAAVNDAPVPADDGYTTSEDTPVTIDAAAGLLANDADIDSLALTAAVDSAPTNGSLSLGMDGAFTYTPAADFSGTDAFTYALSDSAGSSAIATASITVAPVNDAPTVPVLALPEDGASFDTGEDVVLSWNDSTDVEGDALEYRLLLSFDGTQIAALIANDTDVSLDPGLDAGSYTWQVEAIDAQNLSSGLSLLRTFALEDDVIQTGGCTCSTTVSARPGAGGFLLLALPGLLLARRRRLG